MRVSQAAVRFMNTRLDEFVAPSVTRGGERRFQARVLCVLLAFALGGALCFPLVLFFGAAASVAALPLILAAVALASAAWLSIAGRADAVLWFWGTIVSISLTLMALNRALPPEFAIAALAILPLEAGNAKRYRLAAGLVAVSLACGGLLAATAALEEAGMTAGSLLLGLTAVFYGLRLVVRGAADRGLDRHERDDDERRARRRAAEEFGTLIFEVRQSGRIDHASSKACEVIAGGGHSCSGDLFGELCHVADRLAVMQAIDDARSGNRPAPFAARLKVAEGRFCSFGLTIRQLGPLAQDGDDDRDVLVIAESLVLAPESDLSADLEAACKASAAKSQFLATVSHELRTPLNAIIGFSDVLDHEYFGGFESVKQKEYVGLIRQSGQHLLSIVNTLLDVSKIEAGRYDLDPETFDLSVLMREIGDLMREEARCKGLRLDVRPARGLELVADRRACRQILLNLVSNALKFTESGVVTVESRLCGSDCEMLVSDTGIGIAEADIGRLGAPFVQLSSGLSRRYQGTGLGLSLVKGLAELHGGAMSVTSQPGVGTMVTVRVPVDGPSADLEPSASTPENIVALSDARSKTNFQAQIREKRRSA
ncbi:sensor histidine kinase [Jiella mangrovi]|uniref:histidine kinase n=1 Tax=Jiella mangrovi TaxID=2821407 RepID=A0ABS4BI69_9HYPH|nr:HAMP domain-containing sensor histidine kinase [Jiella mangrovi]MBP0615650.1 HAMP domain-containing histidine kinase [Jiella mangrovi]